MRLDPHRDLLSDVVMARMLKPFSASAFEGARGRRRNAAHADADPRSSPRPKRGELAVADLRSPLLEDAHRELVPAAGTVKVICSVVVVSWRTTWDDHVDVMLAFGQRTKIAAATPGLSATSPPK